MIVAAQREPPEAPPAAIERAEQGRAVLRIGGADGLPAAVRRGCIRRSQQLPSGRQLRSIMVRVSVTTYALTVHGRCDTTAP